ncbi:MAG: Flp pilus assembly protein CpaB [Acidisphaera sp.]|nr:Flp pilus assembly protein CpaB [Acidisphaera sp.]
MLLRIALFALMALGLGGFGTVAYLSTRPPPTAAMHQPAAPAPPVKEKVLVAAHPLRAGSLLKPDDMGSADIDQPQVPVGASADTPAARTSLLGAMVRRSLSAGDPLLPTDVMRPGDHGFLAAVLGPNMRAITVGVDAISGSAGLIWPGDRVDLILTQTIDQPNAPLGRRIASETVLADVRVIAIDQQLVQGVSPEGSDQRTARTATLEVTGPQAEEVTVAAKLGPLSLVVRSAEHGPAASLVAGAPATPGPVAPVITWAGDVSPALNETRQNGGGAGTVKVFTGNQDGKEFHFQ